MGFLCQRSQFVQLQRSRDLIPALCIFASLLGLSGCNWGRARVASKPVIEVNGASINLQEFSDRLSRELKSFDALSAKDPTLVERAKNNVIHDYLTESLFSRFADTQKISVSESEWDKEVNEIRSGFPDDISFRRALAEDNLSLTEWREKIRFLILQRKVFGALKEPGAPPSESEISKYYDENKEKFRHGDRVYLRQIVVDDLGKAQDLAQELKKKRFEELATKYSISPESKRGGLVGWVEKGSIDIFDKAFSQSVGGNSAVLESAYGFHIFRVEKKEPAGIRKLSEVKALIEKILAGQKEQREYTQWLDAQLRSSKVAINRDLIRQLKVETRE